MRFNISSGATFGAILVALWLNFISQSEANNQYHLIFEGTHSRTIQVEAEVEMVGNTLRVHSGGIWFLPETESWWQRITIEGIEDLAGNPLKPGNREGNRLTIEGASDQRIRIRYNVDISYIDQHLPYGNTAAGAAFPEGYFTVAKPLFVTGDSFPGARIIIEKPNHLRFDAPWETDGEVYFADSFETLTRAAVSIGDYEVLTQTSSGLDYRLIAFGFEPEVKSILSQTMTTVSRFYLEHFPLPSASRYLQFVFPARHIGGEAYPSSSVSAVVPERISEGHWKMTLAHELFHVWNPFLIPGAEREEMEWFKEGFTNFLSERALVETGEIEETTWENHAQAQYNKYIEGLEAAPERITIVTSGANKGEYGTLVYDGGRAIAAWLDRELIRASGGETDLKVFVAGLINAANIENTNLDVNSFLAAVAAIDPAIAGELKTYLMTKAPVPEVVGPER